jgi:hypothetical protein
VARARDHEISRLAGRRLPLASFGQARLVSLETFGLSGGVDLLIALIGQRTTDDPTAAATIGRSLRRPPTGDQCDSDPDHGALKFVGYFYEPKAQDHQALHGGGLQLGVAGAPRVFVLEKWSESRGDWSVVWRA